MPTRLVREGYLSSAAVDQLDAQAERFYFRMYLVVDDYGRFEFRPELLKSQCFPVKTAVRVSDISRWTAACVRAGLVVIYEHDDRQYIQILKFQQRTRHGSKYPSPPGDSPVTDNDGLDVFEGVSEGEGEVSANGADPPEIIPRTDKQKNTVGAIWLDCFKRSRGFRYRISPRDKAAIRDLGIMYSEDERDRLRHVFNLYLADADPWLSKQGWPLFGIIGRTQKYEGQPPQQGEDDDGSSDQTGLESAIAEAKSVAAKTGTK